MILKKKYVIGCLVQFYEIEMFPYYIDGILNMIKNVENKENIIIDIHFSTDEHFEEIDTNKTTVGELQRKFMTQIRRLQKEGLNVKYYSQYIKYPIHKWVGKIPYNIAHYRRDFNYKYCDKVDYVIWGETDSYFPSEAFDAIEQISNHADQNNINRHVITFSYRKMWDDGWKIMEHPEFTNIKFEDTDEWNLHNPASEKYTMSINEMNEINSKADSFDIRILNEPKFDGSCLVINSEIIKSGVNIPHGLLLCGEDTGFAWMAKKIMGNNYIQFHVKNLLRVHNRRHSKKRFYIKGENNQQGFCDVNSKGQWWKVIEQMSKYNLSILGDVQNKKFCTYRDYFKEIENVKNK